MRLKMVIPVLAALGLAAPMPAAADQPVVVELFTSQGCSSCPPADRLLGELAERGDVIALAYHVDYWDYLGWKDTFADAKYSDRQRDYAPQVDRSYIGRAFRGSFTPEVVVQGTDSLIGSAARIIQERIDAYAAADAYADILMERASGGLIVRIDPAGGTVPATRVMMARYMPRATVEIGRGENAGRSLTYHRVVTELRQIGDFSGQGRLDLRVPEVDGPVVIFLQRGDAGPILAAAELS
ncbi:MAG: DUF1223 domain-containing protein [Pseudomonadota bacterium]